MLTCSRGPRGGLSHGGAVTCLRGAVRRCCVISCHEDAMLRGRPVAWLRRALGWHAAAVLGRGDALCCAVATHSGCAMASFRAALYCSALIRAASPYPAAAPACCEGIVPHPAPSPPCCTENTPLSTDGALRC
eukprot:355843-Chlamydomonas_euryale.AAC.5